MKKLTSAEIRSRYIDFFARRGHTVVPSSPVAIYDDPTVLFANSGMVPFKDVFLGLQQRPYTRATSVQKCLRVSGKHNDLEEVGPSPRHHTFFEMLGNFSFGDYFKREAIPMAWDLLVNEFELPIERLYFTVFGGDDQVPADTEAEQFWLAAGAAPERILRFGRSDNFWVMGETGPCGPSSEITMYIGEDLSNIGPQGVNSDDPDYVEIWNNVFMQFERATMEPLPRPSIDTGMGLERMAMVMQGVHATYDTDIFVALIDTILGLRGADRTDYEANRSAYRAVADHSRAVAFLIAEGVLPGPTGRSYVLRRLLRRAVYMGRSFGFERPFLAQVVDEVVAQMGQVYPELVARRSFILESVDAEEQQFLRTLSGGLGRLGASLDLLTKTGETVVPGVEAFTLKDTYGFPLDLTQKIAAGRGLMVDEAGYDAAMREQKGRSKAASQFRRGTDAEVWAELSLPQTRFVGYDALQTHGAVLALVSENDALASASAGQAVQIALDTTTFYAESGGQVGDAGELVGPHGRVAISDTQRPVPGITVHIGTVAEGTVSLGETLQASVDRARRAHIARNHTATHLLHRALRDTLGEHAAQAGSLVAPDRLRFDFTHNRQVTPDQLRAIEAQINAWVRADGQVSWDEMPYQRALDTGAMALFGEKYGDTVRVVDIRRGDEPSVASRDSQELCGGTHVRRTGEIGLIRVVAESSVAGGVRRIEVVTGGGAEQAIVEQTRLIHDLAGRLGATPAQLIERLDATIAELKQTRGELETLKAQAARAGLETLLTHTRQVDGVALLAANVAADDAAALRAMGDWLRDKLGSAAIVLAAAAGEKVQLLAVVTPDLVKRGYHAGNLVKTLAPLVGGTGGGRADMAQAGGRDLTRIDDLLAAVPEALAAQRPA